ncbi:hypothetical protein [Streptomyces atratus]|uniref:hypothetical protein n=1 Tax=Streptomyces atratus TaxID=1893 RepID=UPI00364A9152
MESDAYSVHARKDVTHTCPELRPGSVLDAAVTGSGADPAAGGGTSMLGELLMAIRSMNR